MLRRSALHGEVERRLLAVGRARWRARSRRRSARSSAPSARPACRARPCRAARALGAVARDAAQHGVDEAGIARGAAVGLRQPHRQIDGGVIGHVEPENLRGADQQRGLDPRRVGGKTVVEQQRRADGAACRAGAARSRPCARTSARSRSAGRQGRMRLCRRAARRAAAVGAARRRRCRRRYAAARPATVGAGEGSGGCDGRVLLDVSHDRMRQAGPLTSSSARGASNLAMAPNRRSGSRDRSPKAAVAGGRARAGGGRGPPRRRRAARTAVPRRSRRKSPGRDGPEPTRYGDWEIKGVDLGFLIA